MNNVTQARPVPTGKQIERFWAKVAIGQPQECWPWLASLNADGYGLVYLYGKAFLAHRVAYEATGVKIVNQLDHLCRNRRCCNPAHLEDVTARENILRGYCPAAIHARKTHCPQGHEYSPENTAIRNGERHCRTCNRNQSVEARARRSAKAVVA